MMTYEDKVYYRKLGLIEDTMRRMDYLDFTRDQIEAIKEAAIQRIDSHLDSELVAFIEDCIGVEVV